MPSNWQSVDSNFPSFTGKESPTEQIRALHNYLYCMKEHLKYSLQNLTADNWNSAALESLTGDAQAELASRIDGLILQISDLRSRLEEWTGGADVADFRARIEALEDAGLDGRITTLEAADLDNRLKVLEDAKYGDQVSDVSDRVKTLEDADLDDRLKALEDAKYGEQITNVSTRVDDLEDEMLPDRVYALERIVDEDGDGNVKLGREDKQIFLVGEIYVNGVLLTVSSNEGGVTDETS